MDKQAILKQMSQVEHRMKELHQEMEHLKELTVGLIEENTQLLMENEYLKDVQADTSSQDEGKQIEIVEEKECSNGHKHLQKLYNEDFHICNVHYGRLRTNGDCLFCLAFLNKSTKG